MAIVADHPGHVHFFSATTFPPDCFQVAAGTGGSLASAYNHVHAVYGDTRKGPNGDADNGVLEHAVKDDPVPLSHTAASHIPPYCDIIFMMKE